MCRQFGPDRGSQTKTNLVLVLFATFVNLGENCCSAENGSFLCGIATSSDSGSQNNPLDISPTGYLLFIEFFCKFHKKALKTKPKSIIFFDMNYPQKAKMKGAGMR